MRPATPKEDGLAHREKSDTTKASPALRTGTPRVGTPRTGTPRTSTPRGKTATGSASKRAEDEIALADDTPAEGDATEPNGGPNGVANEAKADPGFEEREVDVLVEHRVDEANSSVDIRVLWDGGETTWESEWRLQEDVPAMVFKYWDKLGGRDAATKLDVYHVFKILRRDPKQAKKYEVQWVGYPQNDSTWEKEELLSRIARAELEKFKAKDLLDSSNGKRKGARGVGRPRKRPRSED